MIGAEICCPVVAYQDTVSRHAPRMGADFFLSSSPYATPAQRAVTINTHPAPYLVIYGGGVGLAVQLVRIRKLSASLEHIVVSNELQTI